MKPQIRIKIQRSKQQFGNNIWNLASVGLFFPLNFCAISITKEKKSNEARSNNMNLEKMLVKNKTNYLGFLKITHYKNILLAQTVVSMI